MSKKIKNQAQILEKLGIEALNEMQQEAQFAIHTLDEIILLSPTGSGKTLGFLLPIMASLDPNLEQVQAMIIAPSRELAVQIAQVAREMGAGFKIELLYGGRSFSKDRTQLQHPPALIVGTPGRIADHLRRQTFETSAVQTLVLDEFDKALEIGFEGEMTEIIELLPNLQKKVLTSATQGIEVPDFVGLDNPTTVDHLQEGTSKLSINIVASPQKDKLSTLGDLLTRLEGQAGIVFCNFKDSIQRVSSYLSERNLPHASFYGGMEQQDRELSLLKFRNGTHQLLLATDLAARGIDIPDIQFIIHYHLPVRAEAFIHRNGRTARMHRDGTAYVLHWTKEELPDFIADLNSPILQVGDVQSTTGTTTSEWTTLRLSLGRRDKVSKGDIAGFFFRQGELKKDELGRIELKQAESFVAVPSKRKKHILKALNNGRLKKKKVRIWEV
ncbi:MAG: DEAD/DEAH box helicase [Bacteroidota bacterium]